MKGATSEAGTTFLSGAPEFTPSFYPIFSLMCMFCKSIFVLLYFFFWPLCCLSFDLRILTISLVSSNSSYIVYTPGRLLDLQQEPHH